MNLKTTKLNLGYRMILIILSIAVLALQSCKEDEVIPSLESKSILGIVADNSDFSLLGNAVNRAGLGSALENGGPFTVFAPTNQAFNAIGISSSADFDGFSTDDLANILTYHVVSGSIGSGTLSSGTVTALNGESLNIQVNGSQITINGIRVITADIQASNGIIHVIEGVLLPPSEEPELPGTITDIVVENDDFSLLRTAVIRAGLAEALAADGALTVFAPNNQAFNKAGFNSAADIQAVDVATLTTILTYHVVAGKLLSGDLSSGTVAALSGEELNIVVSGGNVSINGVNVIAANIEASNGVIHVLDDVLMPPSLQASNTIVDIALGNENFSLLVAALARVSEGTSTNVIELLSGTDNFTVFAPVNQAFIDAGFANESAINAADPNTLLGVLAYHVISGKILAADIPAATNTAVGTIANSNIFATRRNGSVFINGNPVITANIEADNGVIHVIDRVLIPASGNIVETAIANDNFSYLVAAVVRASSGSANIAEILSGDGPFTVFAPVNQAFIDLGFSTIADIEAADPEALIPILTYHVIPGRIFSSDLTNGAKPATAQGQSVEIGLTGGATVKGNGNDVASNIILTNVLPTNGVIHAIDRILLPGSGD
jgi:transforming growth factor-beta-induced protein